MVRKAPRASGVRLALTARPAPPIGVAALAEIDLGRARPARFVPAAALHAPTGSEAEVTVCGTDGHAHTVRVTVGHQTEGQVEVRPVVERSTAVDAGPPTENSFTTRMIPGAAVVIEPILGVEDGAAIEKMP